MLFIFHSCKLPTKELGGVGYGKKKGWGISCVSSVKEKQNKVLFLNKFLCCSMLAGLCQLRLRRR